VNLTADNTAIVLDSTADFPDAAQHFPNWRVVPLYVNFGMDSFRDGVDLTAEQFYERLRASTELPTTSQPTPSDFLSCYVELARYERILSLHLAANLSGTFQSAGTAAAELGDGRVRSIDTETASAGITLLAMAIQRRLDRGTTDEEVDELVERYKVEHGMLFTVDTLEFLARGGRIGRAKAFCGRAAAREAHPVDSQGRGDSGQTRARCTQGVPGVRRRARVGDEGRAGAARRCRARRRAREGVRAGEDGA